VIVLRIEQFEYFLEAAKTGSFSKAADNFYLQQPSLRHSIVTLEEELGQDLFLRTSRGVVLTEYGKAILPYVEQIINTVYKIKSQKLDNNNNKILTIEASSFCNMMVDFFSFEELFSSQNNSTKCRLSINNDILSIVKNVVTNKTNIGLIYYLNTDWNKRTVLKNNRDKKYKLFELISKEIGICIRKDHPLAKKNTIQFEDIVEYLVIFSGMPKPIMLDTILNSNIDKNRFNYVVVTSPKLVRKYCLQENGIFISSNDEHETIDEEDLVFRKFSGNYTAQFSAIVKANENSDEIFNYILLLQQVLKNKSCGQRNTGWETLGK